MRFKGEHIGNILPVLFCLNEKNKNKEFTDSDEPKKFGKIFDEQVKDERFDIFYNALQNAKTKFVFGL